MEASGGQVPSGALKSAEKLTMLSDSVITNCLSPARLTSDIGDDIRRFDFHGADLITAVTLLTVPYFRFPQQFVQ